MKKFLLIIIIVAYCFISFFVLFENSTDMSIDYTQLRTKNDYKRSVDEIPENISEKMVLKIKNKYDNLKLDIEGEYYRQPINEQTLKIISKTGNNNPSFVWNRFNTKYENSGKVDVMIIFTSNNTCVIYFPLKNIINTYDVIYNDRTLQLKDEFFKIASFDCNFLYTHNVTQYKQDKIENVVDNNTPTNEDATGDNQNHNSSDKNTADTFENKDTSFFLNTLLLK